MCAWVLSNAPVAFYLFSSLKEHFRNVADAPLVGANSKDNATCKVGIYVIRKTKMSDTVKLMIELPKEIYNLCVDKELLSNDDYKVTIWESIANGTIISDKFVAVDDFS